MDSNQTTAAPQLVLLDFLFPGFSTITAALVKHFHIDLNMYFSVIILVGGVTFVWRYLSDTFWTLVDVHLMSTVDIRTDDELYNFVMAWISAQHFSHNARRFIASVNLNSRTCYSYWDSDDEDDDDDYVSKKKKKPLAYTPNFGSHYFWYKRHLLVFRRSERRDQGSSCTLTEREEISICSFTRSPRVLKELLDEARYMYTRRDEGKTLIYRGSVRSGSLEPGWQRCMTRTSRPFSTVILNEKVKQDLIRDVADYLNPATMRWYANRGIPYRRGYLLHGPPGTGKSSLSLALAGHFKMRIYIVSLSSVTSGEETLANLFAELPHRCVVLLEDIDSAGITHSRLESKGDDGDDGDNASTAGDKGSSRDTNNSAGRLSLSGLLNIIDGVASQEGRILIMTTNHLEKLDKALIRPGRVDMIVKFTLADRDMAMAIFRAIFMPVERDESPDGRSTNGELDSDMEKSKRAAEAARKAEELVARVQVLAREFAAKIPEHEFSPAEIQGFLLKQKRDPDAAVAEVEQWVAETRKVKTDKERLEAKKKEYDASEAAAASERSKVDGATGRSERVTSESLIMEDVNKALNRECPGSSDLLEIDHSNHEGDSGYGTP